MTARLLLVAALLAISSACGTIGTSVLGSPAYVSDDGNYIRLEHPFTDEAAEGARRRAVDICASRKQIATKTTSVCTLTKCTTNYQCSAAK